MRIRLPTTRPDGRLLKTGWRCPEIGRAMPMEPRRREPQSRQSPEERLIIRHVSRGTFLSELAQRRADAPADTSPAEIMQMRLVIEPPVAALATRVATQAEDRITVCLEGGS